MDVDLREIARRAARNALAGSEPGASIDAPPAPAPRRSASPRRREVVTAGELAGVADGGSITVPDGAVVTPLAREEADRRGIRLTAGLNGGQRLVAVGCDHGGFALKDDVMAAVRDLGHRVLDLGTRDTNPVDYPDYARAVAEAVASGQCAFGICIDGAGIGSAIAASKVPGVRAATCCDERMAANAREHNYANVLSIGSGYLDAVKAHAVVRTFLTTAEGPERHARRVAKIDAIERHYSAGRTRGAPKA
jgi:ribose 5-phosphate isomerase B